MSTRRSSFFQQPGRISSKTIASWRMSACGLPAILRIRKVRQATRVVSDRRILAQHRRVGVVAAIRRYARFARYGGDALFAEGIGAVTPAE